MQGKPSGKKHRTGSVNHHTECGLSFVLLWLIRVGVKGEDQKVWRVRNRREGVETRLSLNSVTGNKWQLEGHPVFNMEIWSWTQVMNFSMIIMWPNFGSKFSWSVCEMGQFEPLWITSQFLWWKISSGTQSVTRCYLMGKKIRKIFCSLSCYTLANNIQKHSFDIYLLCVPRKTLGRLHPFVM